MKIFKYLKPYILFAILAPITMVGEVLMDLFLPKTMSNIVDIGLGEGKTSVILTSGLLMLAFTVVGGICGFASAGFASAASQGFADDLRRDCFKKIMNLSFQQTDKFSTGSLVTRITNDIDLIRNLVSMSVRMLIRTLMQFVGGTIFLLLINPNFGFILLTVFPIILGIIILFIWKVSPLFLKVQLKLDEVNSVVQENVGGARVVKAYNREEYEKERFDTANTNLCMTNLKVQKIMAYISPVLMIIVYAAVVVVIYIGGKNVILGNGLKVGEVMSSITYISQILMSLMMLGMMFQSITRAAASIKRINEILDAATVIDNGTKELEDVKGYVSFNNVTFRYPETSGEPALKNINISVKPGETLAILGATGSGKSTMVNLIPRFYDVTDGEIDLDGVNIKELTLHNLRRNIGVVFQKTELFTGTIEENIKWGNGNATKEQVIEACKIAQADDFITGFKDGYDTIIGEKGSSLSGGQKQRLAIARAIVKKPKVLIFDDATSALDLKTEASLYKALRENLKDTTIFLVAQRVASAKGATKIMVLDDGKVSAVGTSDQLLKTSKIYQDIYNSQLKQDEVVK